MRGLLATAVLLLAACGEKIAEAPKAGDTLKVPAFEWRVRDQQTLEAIYSRSGLAPGDGRELRGFAGVDADGTLAVYTSPPIYVDGDATCTLGHEVIHLVLGEYHK